MSTCGTEHAAHRDPSLVVYACVLLNRSSLRADDALEPLARTYTPDAFVGRVFPSAAKAVRNDTTDWDDYFPIVFDVSHADVVGGFRCTRGVAHGLTAGEWTFTVVHEHAQWSWAPLWDERGEGPFGARLSSSQPSTVELRAEEIITRAAHASHAAHTAQLPSCTNNLAGRWKDGVYTPTDCILRNVSFPEFEMCMSRLGTVFLFGDSNGRRAMKVLETRGQWCTSQRNSSACQCEDCGNTCEGKAFIPRLWWSQVVYPAGAAFGTGKLVMHGMDGYNPGMFSELNAEPPRVVVVGGFGAWPEAKLELSAFVSATTQMVSELQRLPATTALVFRTGPYFCCAESPFRRYTAKRQAIMTTLFKRTVDAAFPDALWWDTRALGEARPMAVQRAQVERCVTNHMDSVLVEQDAHVLMHLLCLISEQKV